MKKNSFYIFGNKRDAGWLNSQTVHELLDDARERALAAARPDMQCVLNIIDLVGQSWSDPQYHLRKKAQKILPQITMFSPKMIEQGFAVISHLCRRKNLEKRIVGELGSIKVLDDGEDRPHHNYRLRALGGNVIVHLTAGNVFLGAVDSLLSGIISKNANILKMSRVDTVFPQLFLESIKEHDPAGLIWPNQAAVSWKGGDEDIENVILNADVTVVFWGGFDALRSVKSRLGHQTRLVENGPRYSFAVVEGNLLRKGICADMIRGLALDISRWDQQACSSPHVVYVIDKGVKTAHALTEALYDEMLELEKNMPVGDLDFDEKVEIRKVRELARMSQAIDRGRLVCPENFAFSLILENDSEFKVSCLNRTLFIKPVRDVGELMHQVRPLAGYLQTAGLYCTPELGSQLTEELLQAGAQRITEIGGMSEGHDGAPHEGEFMLRRLVRWVSIEHRESDQSRIEKLLQGVEASPYYRGLLARAGGNRFRHFLSLPLLDRETFYRNSPPESTDILTGPMTDAYVYASGGTTGSPKFALYSNEEYRYVTDVLTHIYLNAGLNSGDRVANLFIAGNLWTSFNVVGRALENLGCLNLPVGGASDMDNIIKYLQIFRVNAVVGLPSIIIKLAEEVKKRKIDLQIEKILYGGEHLRPQTCEFLFQTLNTRLIRSAGYACVDTGPIGWQCEHLEGSVHHVQSDYCYAELVDTETLNVIDKFDQPGEIVATNLNRLLMPVLRYRTGDLGRWVDLGLCQCGFVGRSFELLGRSDDLLVIGGINLLPSDIAPGLAKLDVGQSFQIAGQTANGKDQLCLRLESAEKISDAAVIKALRSGSYKIGESLSQGWMHIAVEWFKPGGIPENKRTGKIKTVVDERG